MRGQDSLTPVTPKVADADQGRGTQVIAPGMLGDIRRSTLGSRRDIDHWHDDVEFDLIVRGEASYALDDQVYTAPAGTLIWLAPGQRHKLLRSPNLQMWVVMFRPSLLAPGWLEDLAAQPSRVIASHELIDLDHLLSQIAQDSDEPAAYNAGVRYVVMRALRASRDRPSASLKPMHPAVTRALLLMRQQRGGELLSELAAEAGIAAPYLSRLLVEQTGRGFVDWRNRLRLDRFIEGYTPGTNLLNAALDAGFGSYTRFHHIFTEMVGCSPSEWVSHVDAGRPAPRLGAAAPVAGFRTPSIHLPSARQRWTSLLPVVAPAIGHVVGEGFADRLVTATPRDTAGPTGMFGELETELTAEDVGGLVAACRTHSPELAADYARLLAAHDFRHVHANLFSHLGLAPSWLPHLVGGLIGMFWSAMRNADMLAAEATAVGRQVEGALAAAPPRVDAATLRAARVALQCHFVVAYQAAKAARAGGDERLFDAIRTVGREWTTSVFGRDISELSLTRQGLVGASAQPALVRARQALVN